jgi:hypothetical protein
MRILQAALLTTCAVLLIGGDTRAQVTLSGPTTQDGTYSSAALAAQAVPADTINYNGFTGITLWGLLGGANASSPTSPNYGAITTSTPAGDNGKNAIFRYFVVATGSGGAQTAVSAGQIDPQFGGTTGSTGNAPAAPFVAFQATGGSLLSEPMLIVPGQSGSTVANLSSLQLLSVPAISGSGGTSTSVTLSGNTNNPGTYNLAALKSQFPSTQQTVGTDTYTGIKLSTFLNPSSSNPNNQIVVTRATDGYSVVYSLAEILANPSDLLAYADTGGNFPGSGVARTIFPGDNAHGRWQSNLVSLQVESAVTPLPGSWTMMLIGLAGFGFLAYRRHDRVVIAA